MDRNSVTRFNITISNYIAPISIALICSGIIAFISTNAYWALTASYAKPVVAYGEKAVLSGLEAATYLISKHGLKAYLYGAIYYFMVALLGSFVACVINYQANRSTIFIRSGALSIACAFVYFFLDLNVYVYDRATGKTGVVDSNILRETGLLWLAMSLTAHAILFFITITLTVFLARLFLAKIDLKRSKWSESVEK